MKRIQFFAAAFVALVFGVFVLASCQKDRLNDLADSKKYSPLTLEAYMEAISSTINSVEAEKNAVRLYDLKDDGDGLLVSELRSVGDPSKDQNLLVALKMVEESPNRNDVYWSWDVDADAARLAAQIAAAPPTNEVVERVSKYKWTGGASKYSFWCSGSKQWPAKYNMTFAASCTTGFYYDAGYVCKSSLTCPPYPN